MSRAAISTRLKNVLKDGNRLEYYPEGNGDPELWVIINQQGTDLGHGDTLDACIGACVKDLPKHTK